jgi:hypothetical protein
MTHFQVVLVRCNPESLNLGKNQDQKSTISKKKIEPRAMRVIVAPMPMLPNFVAEMDADIRKHVMAEPTIQRRVTKLFQLMPGIPIPRDAVRTVAQTEGDPMRRVRADTHAGDPLGGYKVLSATYANRVVQALGYPPLRKDEFMSIRATDIDKLSPAQRRQAGLDE